MAKKSKSTSMANLYHVGVRKINKYCLVGMVENYYMIVDWNAETVGEFRLPLGEGARINGPTLWDGPSNVSVTHRTVWSLCKRRSILREVRTCAELVRVRYREPWSHKYFLYQEMLHRIDVRKVSGNGQPETEDVSLERRPIPARAGGYCRIAWHSGVQPPPSSSSCTSRLRRNRTVFRERRTPFHMRTHQLTQLLIHSSHYHISREEGMNEWVGFRRGHKSCPVCVDNLGCASYVIYII